MKNPLKAKLKTGKPTVGTWITIGHPDVAEIIAMLGFDWFVSDTEHSPFGIETSQVLLQAASYNPECVPLVRVEWNDVALIKKALDIGAYGVVIPWVSTWKEAQKAVEYCKYPPEGIRGFGPRRAALRDPEYVKTANDELLIAVQIETQTALDNLDEICAVRGIDVCYIGPNDLSMSLGIFGQFDHPKFKEALDRLLTTCKKYGIAPGMHCNEHNISGALAQGFQFCALGNVSQLLIKGARDAINAVKGWTPRPYKG